MAEPLPLDGCTPEPLMNYLKALGVLRLVTEQDDPNARGCWCDGVFLLESKLDKTGLIQFFLERYRPTPIVAPWGARSGFFPSSSERAARQALEEIDSTTLPRLERFRTIISMVRKLLVETGLEGNAKDDFKGDFKLGFLHKCRANLPDDLLDWLDACFVLIGADSKYPPLLGTGGNEGSGSYVSGFAQQLVACVIRRQHDKSLETALFGTYNRDVASDQTPGHFSPSAAGGPNAGQGTEGPLRTNPWDYVMCLEGACLWASSVVRRLGITGPGMAAFPFTVNVSGAGAASLALGDSVKPKQAKRPIAEMWLPLWSRPVGLGELKAVLAEGRASVGKRLAANGVDFARAMAELGVDRGLSGFARNAFLMRNGQSFLAVPLGVFQVHLRQHADLLHEVDAWLDSFRRACRSKEEGAKTDPPARLRSALRSIDTSVFDFCKYGGQGRLAEILCALGAAERELAVGDSPPKHRRVKLPLDGLTVDWLTACDDGSQEFRLARGLAFVQGDSSKTGWIRRYLEPVEAKKGDWFWTERGGHVVWASGNLVGNLGAVLARRLMDAEKDGEGPLPLSSPLPVPLADVAAFLTGQTDDQKIENLLWGLMLVNPAGAARLRSCPAGDIILPSAYALLKLTLLPGRLEWGPGSVLKLNRPEEGSVSLSVAVKAEPAIFAKLRAGDVRGACEIAARRLRASGFVPLASYRADGSLREIDWNASGIPPARLLAALLFPIPSRCVNDLADLVLRRPKVDSLL